MRTSRRLTDDGYARAIWPIHTMVDGDTVFAIATGSQTGRAADVIALGALAADVMATAVDSRRDGRRPVCRTCPAVRDLK